MSEHGFGRLNERQGNRFSVVCLCGWESAIHIQLRMACRELSEHEDVELENESSRS